MSELIAPIKSLCLDYPIRLNFLAQIVIPLDMTEREAARLCDFIKTLPITASDSDEQA